MKNKKAQGLPMNTIVIAALVLVVMIVLILIFTGNIGGWREDVDKTETSAMARAKCIAQGGKVQVERCDSNTQDEIDIVDIGDLKCCVTITPEERCEKMGGEAVIRNCGTNENPINIPGLSPKNCCEKV